MQSEFTVRLPGPLLKTSLTLVKNALKTFD